jgi:hypothetical protein
MITAKIDVTKIDKNKLFKGEKGTYLDIVLIESPNSQYGDDYMVVQGVTKEEREAGKRGAVLGNAKIRGQRPAQQQNPPAAAPKAAPAAAGGDEDVPF